MHGVDVYKKIEVETKVNSSTPYELVIILYSAALKEIDLMKAAIEGKDHEAKARHCDKAMRIISDGLRSSLDMEKGAEVAENLFNLYTYFNREILAASVANSLEKLQVCRELLIELQSAWEKVSQVEPAHK